MVDRLNRRSSVTVRGNEAMAFKSKKHADEDMAAAIESWILDLERNHKCRVRVVVNATGAAGRLTVRVEACDVVGAKLVGVRVKREALYPNSHSTSFFGAILKELMALDTDLEQYTAFCEGRASPRGVS